MTPSVRLSRRSALALLAYTSENLVSSATARAHEELRRALEPRPRRSLKSGPSKQALKKAKRLTKNAETTEIRESVFARAGSVCELCGERPATDLHHAFGRVRVRQSVANTVASCRPCHNAVGGGKPSAAYWWNQVACHFAAHGYVASLKRARDNEAFALAKARLTAGAA